MSSKEDLLSNISDKPPSDLLDSEDAKVDEDSLNESVESLTTSPDIPSLPIKSYASNLDKNNGDTKQAAARALIATQNLSDSQKPDFDSKRKQTEVFTPRRSSRANKGIGKEIFDPSYIPSSQKKHQEPKRFDSPNTERSTSPSSSSNASPVVKRRRIVVGSCPLRRSRKDGSAINYKKKEQRKKRDKGDRDGNSKKSKPKQEPRRPLSKEDFSDEDDNVPLKKLKEDEEPSESESEEKTEERPQDDDSDDDTDSDDSDDSYNNPGRLWCICKKPHNNRFMISCDQCEDWFHGDCVGISLQRGKIMEENNEEYVCPKCLKATTYEQDSTYVPHVESSVTREDKDQHKHKVEAARHHKRSSAMDVKLQARKNLKGYAMLGQIQSAKKKGRSSANNDVKVGEKKLVASGKSAADGSKVKGEATTGSAKASNKSSSRKCIVSSCVNDALPGSVYCSNQCILKHAKESLISVTNSKSSSDGKVKQVDPQKREGGASKIPVVCRKTRKILSGPSAPRRKDLSAFLKKHPSYKVFKQRVVPHDQTKARPTNKDGSKPTSTTDFYKHVESQHKRWDRYGDQESKPPHASQTTSLDKKHRVIKPVGQSQSSKSSNSSSNQQSTKVAMKPERSSSISGKPHKVRKDSDDRKTEAGSRMAERRDSKEHKRKLSLDHNREERPAKKVERSPSGGGKSSKSDSKSASADVRQNVKKSLFDILKSRSEQSEDLKMHPDSIMRLAAKIEDSLFKVYEETNMKYKNKYRSMMFNLKDTRNHGLWRKVIIGEVTTAEFVLMTAEQMASKKLAEWRKNELTQELDIIQKQEKEIANIRPVAKITHKGEIAIQEDLSDMTENFTQRDTSSIPTIAPTRKKRISMSEEDPLESVGITLPGDTTSQHHDHLFDLNCKICTGKMKEEDLEQVDPASEVSKKVKMSTSIILSTEAQKSVMKSEKDGAPTSHIVISQQTREEKKRKKKKKDKEVESNINSHDPSLSPTSFLSNLSKEKKKKPILPSPPPLADIPHREPELDPEDHSKTPVEEEEKLEEENQEEKVAKTEVKASPPSPAPLPSPAPPPKPTKSKLIWSGPISMLELTTFKANVYPVNGCCDNLDIDLPVRLQLGGRIHPKVVWEYLSKISVLPNKQLSVVRFHAASDDDRVGYVAMLSYFSSRKRFGVVNNQDRMLLKDMYLIPLLESHPVPDQLIQCSPSIIDSLTSNRPSMLLGIVVRQVAVKPLKPVLDASKSIDSTVMQQRSEDGKAQEKEEDDEEYIPDENPPIKETSPSLLLTDEELASKSNSKPLSSGSLLERNRSLAPSLRFFMRKQSEEEMSRKEQEENPEDLDDDNAPYSPGEDFIKDEEEDDGGEYDPEEGIVQDEEEEPYDPEKMFPEEEEEEYDPETAFPPTPSKQDPDDNIPYDPEDAQHLIDDSIDSSEVKALVEKQAIIERMQRELEEKKAKLAQVEQSLQQTPAPISSSLVGTTSTNNEKTRAVDPRLARRAAMENQKSIKESKPVGKSSDSTPPESTPSSTPAQSASVNPSHNPPSLISSSSSSVKPNTESVNPPEVKKDVPKQVDPPAPVDPLQTILSVLNMAQTKSTSSNNSVAGALKIFQKQPSPPPLPDSTTKSDPEDMDSGGKLGVNTTTGQSPDTRHDDDVDKKKKKIDQKRHRSSSVSSSSSHEGARRRNRYDGDDKRHSKRHKRSRSRSPHRRQRHHRHHDDEHRRHHDRSWNRDRRR